MKYQIIYSDYRFIAILHKGKCSLQACVTTTFSKQIRCGGPGNAATRSHFIGFRAHPPWHCGFCVTMRQIVVLNFSSHHKNLGVAPKQYFGPFWCITSTHPASHYPEISRQGRGFRRSAPSPGGEAVSLDHWLRGRKYHTEEIYYDTGA